MNNCKSLKINTSCPGNPNLTSLCRDDKAFKYSPMSIKIQLNIIKISGILIFNYSIRFDPIY